MTTKLTHNGKRELAASCLFWSGIPLLLSRFAERDSLVVLNYHRIGSPDDDLFDSDVFSAGADQFDDQVSYLKRNASLVCVEEALAFAHGKKTEKASRCRVLITLDDGYLDNFNVAFPILRSHGVGAVFFLVTSMIGSSQVPWWDHISYVMKTARNSQFSLRYPSPLLIDIKQNGLSKSLNAVLSLYKSPLNSDPARFIHEFEELAQGEAILNTARRFLDWSEAREMIEAGMTIGSHTHSHTILSQLPPGRQLEELSRSRIILKERLGVSIDLVAYPVGGRHCFTPKTQTIAQETGYRGAFSFYGGTNLPGKTFPFDIKRVYVGPQSIRRFEVQTQLCRRFSKFWP